MCLCFRLCACFFPTGRKMVLLGWGGGAFDLRLRVSVVFLTSCSLCVPVNNLSFSFLSDWCYIQGSFHFILFFKAAAFLKKRDFNCASLNLTCDHVVLSVCSGGRERPGEGVCVLHVCPPPLPHSPPPNLSFFLPLKPFPLLTHSFSLLYCKGLVCL